MQKREIKMTWDNDKEGEGIYIDLQVWDIKKQDTRKNSAFNIGFAGDEKIALIIATKLGKKYNAEVDTQIY